MESEYILQMENITKEFPGIKALDGVSFNVKKGEIHALCGENGAGKSTLMKVLSGVYQFGTYTGSIIINGKVQQFRNTRDAEEAGISIIYQELSLAKNLSIAENIFMGNEPMKNGLIDWDEMHSKANELLRRVGVDKDSNTEVRYLGIGHQQLVEITKALRTKCGILVLDEPTSALTQSEVEILMNLLKKLKEEGVTCIYISHRLDEVFKLADRVTVLRDGRTVGTEAAENLTEESIINLMVGRSITERYPRKDHVRGNLIFEVKDYYVFDVIENKEILHNINFKLYEGEILGIAGLMGAGRTELVNSIFGAYKGTAKGNVYLGGKELKISSPRDAIKNGLGLITEDRKNYGVIHTASIRENMSIASLNRIPGFISMNETDERVMCNSFVRSLRIKLGSLENRITSLSGGNQQKVLLGRWLMTEPKVLILVFADNGVKNFQAGKQYIGIVTGDHFGMGRAAADLMDEAIGGKGDIGFIYHDADFFVTNNRDGEFKRTIEKKYPNIKIVAESGFTQENATGEVTSAMLLKYPGIKGIYVAWDVAAEQVVAELRAAGKKDIKVVTHDLGANNDLDMALDGNMYGKVADMPFDIGRTMARLAAYKILGKEAPQFVVSGLTKMKKNNMEETWQQSLNKKPSNDILKALGKK